VGGVGREKGGGGEEKRKKILFGCHDSASGKTGKDKRRDKGKSNQKNDLFSCQKRVRLQKKNLKTLRIIPELKGKE